MSTLANSDLGDLKKNISSSYDFHFFGDMIFGRNMKYLLTYIRPHFIHPYIPESLLPISYRPHRKTVFESDMMSKEAI